MAELRNQERSEKVDREQPQRTEREKSQQISRREPSRGLINYYDPFRMLTGFQREMERLFDNLGFGSLPAGWSPQIELYERDNKLVVSADLPGLNKDDVKVEINDNVLTIEGDRKNERRDEQAGWSERTYGRFVRSIALPEGINGENANATFKNGVLEITLDAPRQAQPRGRRIEVK
ncbi:MAG TPA: Hsp20/alpha crystallin family protein [Thermoanaerobaculia bacterium]|nr:Hsp20/alpha crystallin family protein [Thermoanaerobaculia bacterium]